MLSNNRDLLSAYALPDIQPGKKYSLKIAALASGYTSSYTEFEFTVNSAPVVVAPPTTPTNITAELVNGNTIILKWDPSTSSVGIQEYVVERDGEALPQLIVDTNCTDTLPVDPVFSMIENGVGGQILVSSTDPSVVESSSTEPSGVESLNFAPSGITASAISLTGITAPELTAPYSTQNTSIGTIIVEKLFVKYTLYAIDKTRQKSKPIEISVNLLLDDYVNAPSLAKLITLSTPLHTQTGRHHNQADVDAFKFIAVAGGRYTFSSTSDVKMTLLDVTDHSSGVPVNLVSVDTPSVIPPVNTVVVSPPSELNAPSLPGTGEITNPIEQAHEAFGISVPGESQAFGTEALGIETQNDAFEVGLQSEALGTEAQSDAVAQPTGGIPSETNGISMGTFYRDLKAGRSYVILVTSTSTKVVPGAYGFVVQVPTDSAAPTPVIVDDYGDTNATAHTMAIQTTDFTQTGKHHNQADVDAFTFNAPSTGTYYFVSNSKITIERLNTPTNIPINSPINTPLDNAVTQPATPADLTNPTTPGIIKNPYDLTVEPPVFYTVTGELSNQAFRRIDETAAFNPQAEALGFTGAAGEAGTEAMTFNAEAVTGEETAASAENTEAYVSDAEAASPDAAAGQYVNYPVPLFKGETCVIGVKGQFISQETPYSFVVQVPAIVEDNNTSPEIIIGTTAINDIKNMFGDRYANVEEMLNAYKSPDPRSIGFYFSKTDKSYYVNFINWDRETPVLSDPIILNSSNRLINVDGKWYYPIKQLAERLGYADSIYSSSRLIYIDFLENARQREKETKEFLEKLNIVLLMVEPEISIFVEYMILYRQTKCTYSVALEALSLSRNTKIYQTNLELSAQIRAVAEAITKVKFSKAYVGTLSSITDDFA